MLEKTNEHIRKLSADCSVIAAQNTEDLKNGDVGVVVPNAEGTCTIVSPPNRVNVVDGVEGVFNPRKDPDTGC